MKIKILAFGITKDIFGSSQIEIESEEGLNVGQLKSILVNMYPELGKLNSFFIAVNEEYAEEGQLISAGYDIAIIPPVSGG